MNEFCSKDTKTSDKLLPLSIQSTGLAFLISQSQPFDWVYWSVLYLAGEQGRWIEHLRANLWTWIRRGVRHSRLVLNTGYSASGSLLSPRFWPPWLYPFSAVKCKGLNFLWAFPLTSGFSHYGLKGWSNSQTFWPSLLPVDCICFVSDLYLCMSSSGRVILLQLLISPLAGSLGLCIFDPEQ